MLAKERSETADEVPASGVAPGAVTALLREVFRTPRADGAAALAALRPGQLFGRFELVREIGRGGFGVVYEARDRTLGRAVALKAVRMGRHVELMEERLLHEAEAAAQLSHPNIVTLHDVGQSEHGPYLVMELLRGETLGDRLRRGAILLEDALRIAGDIAKAVAHAHASGIVHRDLTPGNVFLCADGRVKVLDFGMAQAFGRRKLDGGTAPYMAPEQWRGAAEDERTDVFALGVILHQMVSGRLPFPASRALGEPAGSAAAPFPGALAPDAPALGAVIARMLAREPDDRPRDGREVLAALTSLEERSVATPARRLGRSRRAAWGGAVAAGGAVLLAGAVVALRAHRSDETAPVARTSVAEASAPATTLLPTGLVPASGGVLASVPAVETRAPPTAPGAGAALSAVPRTTVMTSLGSRRPDASTRRAAPAAAAVRAAASARVHHCESFINAVPTPPPESGDGVLTIDADPFGEVFVNGGSYGETPGECRVSAGTYLVRVVHSLHGARERRIEVAAGERRSWTADFLSDR